MLELMEEIMIESKIYKCTQILKTKDEFVYICYSLDGTERICVKENGQKRYGLIRNKKLLKSITDITSAKIDVIIN